jgi:hypothetical protein
MSEKSENKDIFNKMDDITIRYLVIDSLNRDRTVWPEPNNYATAFNDGAKQGTVAESFNNIVSIELVDCTMPAKAAEDYPYIILNIKELHSTYAGNSEPLSYAFAILFPERRATLAFARCRFQSTAINKFREPKQSLNKLTFEFRDPNGNLVAFNDELGHTTDTTPPTVPWPKLQNTLTFKIITKYTNNKLFNNLSKNQTF